MNNIISLLKEKYAYYDFSDSIELIDERFFKSIDSSDSLNNMENFLLSSSVCYKYLPSDFHFAMRKFKNHSNDLGVFLIRNMPMCVPVPDKPLDSLEENPALDFYKMALASIGESLGYIVGYAQEKNGSLFHNIVPVRKNEALLSSESSKFLLDFHTEIAFHPYMMDYLLLFCLRPDHEKQAQTLFVSGNEIISQLDSETINVLKQPLFKTGIDFSFGSANGTKGNGRIVSILYGDSENPYFIYDKDLMCGTTDQANKALNTLNKLIIKKQLGIVLDAGDLLIIDNRKAIHGRTQFQARYDGTDRWLLRGKLVS